MLTSSETRRVRGGANGSGAVFRSSCIQRLRRRAGSAPAKSPARGRVFLSLRLDAQQDVARVSVRMSLAVVANRVEQEPRHRLVRALGVEGVMPQQHLALCGNASDINDE